MRILLLSVSLLFCGVLTAQQTAQQLLENIKTQLVNEESMQYDYSLTIAIPDQDAIQINGILKKQGDKYHATIGERWVKSDGQTQWIYNPDLNEVQIYDAKESGGMPFSPEMITDLYESDDFEYAITGKEEMNGRELTLIEFKSLDPGSEYFKMRLGLSTDPVKPVYFKVFSRDGSRYTLHINDIKKQVSFEKSEFTFESSKHPDIQVEDLRM